MSFTKSFEQSYHQSPTWSGSGKKESLDEDDGLSILDGKILDPDTPQYLMATEMESLSTDHFASADSSQGNMWFDHAPHHVQMPIQHGDSLPGSSHQPTNGASIDHQQTFFGHSQGSWTSINSSGTCTPTPTYTPVPQDFEDGVLVHGQPSLDHRQASKATGFGMPASIPMSPQSSQGWMSATSSEIADAQSGAIRSPNLQQVSPLAVQRRDGVRKKNARFEIPKDRNLNTIDHLIKIYTERGDETQLKELKQQKRLLRNRQAALDSRQRKKQHTEDLEREKTRTDQYIKEIEEELESYKLSVHEFAQSQASLQEQVRQMHEFISNLQIERDEMIRTSTLEAENLRRQNNILREHAQQLEQERDALQTGQVGEFANFDSMPLDGGANWNSYNIPTATALKVGHDATIPAQHSSFAPPESSVKSDGAFNQSKTDYPFSWNTFYMCLLFGAFIASNTGQSSSSASKSAQQAVTMPEEYRAESANVLKAVLASAPPNALDSLPAAGSVTALLPHRGRDQSQQPTTISAAELAHISPPSSTSALTDLHTSLTSMSRTQQDLQAFSMTPEQYASITGLDSQDFTPSSSSQPQSHHVQNQHATTQTKPNPTPLQRAIASLRASQDHLDRTLLRNGAWDRSAVVDATNAMAMSLDTNTNDGSGGEAQGPASWEEAVNGMQMQVPEKVVRDFRRMVQETQITPHGGDVVVADMIDAEGEAV